jgi:hypothetical protein
MNENEELDWLAQLAKGGDEMRRQVEQLIQGAQQFIRDGQRTGGPVPPFQQRVVRAVGAAMRELVPAPEVPVRGQGAARGYTTAVGTATGTAITISGGLAMAPMGMSGQASVQQLDLIERNIGRILLLVLVAIAASGLLGVQGPDRAAVDHYLNVIGVALSIAVLIWTGHK